MRRATQEAQRWTNRKTPVVPPAQRSDLLEERLDAEALLIDGRSEQVHRLNETALAVWRCCDGQTSTHRMADQLVDGYDVAFADALDHVDQLVARFASLHLLVGDNGLVQDDIAPACA